MLGYGNLLGAILYKGWIPWDGDVDIMVAEEDFEKLKDVKIRIATRLVVSRCL